jgi:hypothetical protein
MRNLCLIVALVSFGIINAQDTITMKDGTIYTGKVQVVSDESVQIIDGQKMTNVPENGIKYVRFEKSDKNSIYVNRVDINGMDNEFIQIIGYQKGWLSSKITINIDYGQKSSYFGRRDQVIADNMGHPVIFHSMIDALNYLTKRGWEFIDNYPMSSSQGTAYHYLLKRKRE